MILPDRGENDVRWRVIHADHETDHLPALNDVVIARSGFSRIISFRIMVNGKLLDVYEADGIIVSTRQDLQDIIYQQVGR